jgi:O-antigen/teichoic acid export membrane protein
MRSSRGLRDQTSGSTTRSSGDAAVRVLHERTRVNLRDGRALRSLLRARPFVQSAVFTASSIVVSVLGIVSTAVLARSLGPEDFGLYAFSVAFLVFAALFFDFGVFLPAARMAASTTGDERRRVLGASLLAFLPIGLAFSIAVFALSYAVDAGFSSQAGHALRTVAPLALVYPFLQVALQLSQGVDRLHVWSITSVIGQGAFVVLVLAAVTVLASIPVSLALILRAVAFILAGLVFVVWIRPMFGDARKHIGALIRDARAYGFSVYVGRILSVGTYNMDTIMLAAFADARAVGFYVLASTIAYASGLPVLGMSASLFARMTKANRIDRRWLIAAWGVGILAALVAWALAQSFVEIVFSASYLPAAALVMPLVLAQMVRGVTTVYNHFLAAQARGRELRNAAIVLTVSNVILNFALIPPFGAKGAAWASFFALVLNLLAHVFYYRRSIANAARPVLA